MTGKTIGGLATAAFLIVACAVGGTVLAGGAAFACTMDLPEGDAAPPSGGRSVPGYDTDQVAMAATIVSVGARMGVPQRGWVIAVATALQESRLRNLPGGDQDSVGLFQQRPSQGWGTPEQLQNPIYASQRFFTLLLTVAGWQTMPLTMAAQTVQRSAHPDAYAKWEADAIRLVAAAVTSGDPGALPLNLEQCLTGCPPTNTANAAGASALEMSTPCTWVAPVRAPIVSGFRPPDRPNHQGVDLAAARGTPIRAASAGMVAVMVCNVVPVSHGCDRDGGPGIAGCGWYVDIRHPAGVITRYCHLASRPMVTVGQTVVVGQVIGFVGSSGHSSGPHLHFEVHLGGDSGPSGAVNPASWMSDHGAPLGLV